MTGRSGTTDDTAPDPIEGARGLTADPGTTATGGLQVDQPGEYRFTCAVPGHVAAGMRGTLIVESR